MRLSQNSAGRLFRESWQLSSYPEQSSRNRQPSPKAKPVNTLEDKVKKSIMSLDPSCEIIAQLRKVKSKEELRVEQANHKHYIDNLHRHEIQSRILATNERRLTLTKKEAEAAIKLGKALQSVDETDRRPLSLLNGINIR